MVNEEEGQNQQKGVSKDGKSPEITIWDHPIRIIIHRHTPDADLCGGSCLGVAAYSFTPLQTI